MSGMEVNSGEPFDPAKHTVVQLITWLQSQDQNSSVELDGGGTLEFRKMRAHDGGQIRVFVTHEKPKPRPKSKTEKALEDAQVSKTDSPAEAERVVAHAKEVTGPAGRTRQDQKDAKSKEDDDILRGENEGKDQGGTVPGTNKTGSEKSK